MDRKLYFSLGSPYARCIRVLLSEFDLEFEKDCINRLRTEDEISHVNPALAVPVLEDGARSFFDTSVIASWLCANYSPAMTDNVPFTGVMVDEKNRWDDMQVNAALETLTETMVSLLLHGRDAETLGATYNTWPYAKRQHSRMDGLLDWLDGHFTPEGRKPGTFTWQDIALIAVCEFTELRGVHNMSGRTALDGTRGYFSERKSILETVPI